jgi:hypothetical protein
VPTAAALAGYVLDGVAVLNRTPALTVMNLITRDGL